MSGVDLMDQRVSYDKWPHKCHHWIEAWWHHCRSIVLNNCYIVYRKLNPGKSLSASDFRLEIAKSLMNIKEKPRFRGDLSQTCWFAPVVRSTKKKCLLCDKKPRKKCGKCGGQYCNKSNTSQEPCFEAHCKL